MAVRRNKQVRRGEMEERKGGEKRGRGKRRESVGFKARPRVSLGRNSSMEAGK
jgi:hypothetical protein